MKRIWLTLILATASLAAAQTGNHALTNYNLHDLDSRPGLIRAAQGFLTIIEFEDPIEQVATGKPDMLQIEVDNNRILLSPTRHSGNGDLVVTVNGRIAMFSIRIDDAMTPRRYNIRNPEPRRAAISTHNSSRTGEIILSQPSDQGSLPFQFSVNVSRAPNGHLIIQYALTNTGANAIANDPTRLLLAHKTSPVNYNATRVNTGQSVNRVAPGTAEYGTLVIEEMPGDRITLEWPVIEIGPGTEHVIRRDFHVGPDGR